MVRRRILVVIVVGMMSLQVVSLTSQLNLSFESEHAVDSTTLNSNQQRHSNAPLRIEVTESPSRHYSIDISSDFDLRMSVSFSSTILLKSSHNPELEVELKARDVYTIEVESSRTELDFEFVVVVNARTNEGYRFREQITVPSEPKSEACRYDLTMKEAINRGCAEPPFPSIPMSSAKGTPSFVTGKFEYEDREFDETGFTGVNPFLPIRMADVEVFDNSTGTVLATTHTNNQGEFNATISLASATDVAARVLTSSEGSQRLFNQSVTKTPSTGGTVYSLTSSVYSNTQPGTNIDFTSSPTQASAVGVAGAFNIFDMAEYSESYVENLTSQVAPLNLTLYWTAGEGSTGSKWYDLNGHVYLCGTSDDDDSYDDVVILHEIGHYIHLVYSGNPNHYGGHSLTGTYDLRLGFTEGVGTYFAGAIRDYMGLDKPLIYIETTGTNLRFWGFSKADNTDIIAGYSNSTFTAMDSGNEATVGHVIFDLTDNNNTNDGSPGVDDDAISLPNLQGDQMVWDVFIAIKDNETSTGVVNGTRISLETFYDYWVILHPSYASDFQQILLDHNVEYIEDALESDDSYSTATWIETTGSTHHHTFFPAGDADWSKFNGTAGAEWLIKTMNLANGADTILQVYDSDGTTLLASNNDATSSSVASSIQFSAPADATYYIKTYRYADTIPIGRYGDFDLTITDINHPSITSLSPSSGSVSGGYTVDIAGSNFESGATVKFGVYTATDVTWNNATSMTVTVPANIPGYADIKIYNPVTSDGITPQGTLSDGFEYNGSPLDPVISSISPDFGDYTGSTEVTITGDYLIDGLTTALGSTTLASVTVVDAKTIQATVQSVPRGVHTVTVTNPNGASSSIVNGFESTLTEIATIGSTFVAGSPLQNSITITEDVRMSDLYVHVNVSHPIVPAKLNLTLETPSGQMIALFDEIQVANETFYWKSGFDSIFGYNDYPSEALYQLKGESSLGSWTLHASSSSSSTNTLHSWGVTFLEYRHRDHADQVYCAAEYRNHVMSVDSESGDLLFRARYEGAYGNAVSVSNDGRKIFSGGSTYHDGNSWQNSLIHINDAWTGKLLDSYLLTGRADAGSMVETPNGNLVVVTSSQLYLINLTSQTIVGNLSLTYYANYNTYDVAINPSGTIAYVTNKDGKSLQTYHLPSLTSAGNLSTGSNEPTDVIISSDGSFGAIGYNQDIIQLFYTSNLSVYATHTAYTGRATITFNSDDTEIYGGIFSWYAGFMHLNLQSGNLTTYPVDGASFGVYALGERVYIADWGDPSIIVWDSVRMQQVLEIDLAPYDGYSCRDITASEPPGMLSPTISATSHDLVLSWAAPSSGPAVTEYRVYKGDSPGNESYYANVSPSTLTYTDTSASSTALSYYRVSSVMTGLGEGPISPRLTGAPGADYDNDGIADTLDNDDDNDGVLDSDDAFPQDPSEDTDTDGDGTGNNADTDDDGDGVADSSDAFPLDSSEDTDTDGDGTGNNADTDDDGDGVADSSDAFPLDPSEDTDTDGDGTGNNADTDDDGDGWSDTDEILCNTDALDSNSIPSDSDSDGICDEVDSDRAEAGFQAGSVFTEATLSAGGATTCIILENASLQCWGSNAASKLGSGSGGSTPAASNLGSGHTAMATAIGFYNSCTILDGGSVKCWGQSNGGSSGSTMSIGTGRVAVTITAGFDHACAILDNASLLCWGGNSNGQLGDGTTTTSTSPVSVDLGTGRTAAAVAAGHRHTCAILDNASLVCWGQNNNGQLGDGTTTDSTTPVYVDVGSGRYAVAISGGRYHTCAILDDASLKCWGQNSYGQLGDGSTTTTSTPVSVDLGSGRTAASLSVGNIHTCAILDDASLKCWGYGRNGELGTGSTSDSHTPVSASFDAGRTVVAIAAGGGHTCAILDNLTVQCWGENGNGQVGDATTTDRTTPTYVSLGGNLAAVSERDLDGDGTLNIFDTHFSGDDDGDGVIDTIDDYLNNPARSIHCPAGSYGRYVCLDADVGHYASAGSMFQTACVAGTYQASTGQGSCDDADAGYYVDSAAATSQTACTAGTYNPNTASTSSSECTDTDVGYYTSSSGSASQTACTAGTYQPNTGQTSCLDADAGYYVSMTSATSQTACAAGTYQPSTGQASCIDSSAGYYVATTAATSQVACAAGTYQASTGQSSCDDADAGYYVYSSASTSQTACIVGSFQPSTGQTSCLDADAGYYVSTAGSPAQYACSAGTYQPHSGQSSCLDADAGYYVDTTAATSQIACAAGTYQPSTGQSSCLDADSGYFVDSIAATSQTACAAGTYQPSTGQSSCLDADAGYYVDSTAATSQIACAAGTYQPSTGQSSCIDASAGYYVDSAAATSQTACSIGTYQPSTGQSSCIDASAGYYVDSAAATSQTACTAGTYQPSTGQSNCIDANAGYYVDSNASTSQTACATGSYQPSTGQTSCIDASAGYYVGTTAATSQAACSMGTYQPATGQSSCIDASAGYYVDTTAATNQTACSIGTYQSDTGQSSCEDADAGYYVDTTAATDQTACALGTYQPDTGQSSCLEADAGYYVGSTEATSQTECAVGTYQPSTGQSSCLEADAGYFVDTTASTNQTACSMGTYQPITGQSSCLLSDAGYYVDTTGAVSQTACTVGTYQPSTGQSSCIEASAGHYVDSTAATSETACAVGTYQPNTGQSNCLDADEGHFVATSAATAQIACSVGTYQPSTGQSACTDADEGHIVDTTGASVQTPCVAGSYQPSTGQSSCIEADAGHYVANEGAAGQIACSPGTYQPTTGQSTCVLADAGHFVEDSAATQQETCLLGTYQPSAGQSSCLDADAGHFVDVSAAISQTTCSPGTYQPSRAQTSCLETDAGHFVESPGATEQTECSSGSYQPLTAQTECLTASKGHYVDSTGATGQIPCPDGTTTEGEGSTDLTDCLTDTDGDGTPNVSDADDDNDGYLDEEDDLPLDASEWVDTDWDGIGNNADEDDDGDGWTDADEVDCGYDPLNLDDSPTDLDHDGICDELDEDDDGDGINDDIDEFPRDSCAWIDSDGDADPDDLSDDCTSSLTEDEDDDNDGHADVDDAFPLDSTEWADLDGDGVGDNTDTDDDGDGVSDAEDLFPTDHTEWDDHDADGIGDNADPDDDDDGFDDSTEDECDSDPTDEESVPGDKDDDGICDAIDDEDDRESDGLPGFGGLVAALALILAATFNRRRP